MYANPLSMTPLVVRLPNHVGDACMTLPALALAGRAGFAPILVGRPWGAALFAGHDWPFVAIDGRLARDVGTVRKALARVARATYAVTFPKSFSSALLFRLAGLKTAGHAVRGRGWLLDVAEPGEGHGHEVERFFGLMRTALHRWGRPVDCAEPPASLGLALAPRQRDDARKALAAAGVTSRYALLAPIATGLHHGRSKQWPGFARLVEPLAQRGLACVVAPPPAEVAATQAVLPAAVRLPPVDLGTLAALAHGAAVVIANDSGVSHVAAAVGAPQVTVFGATDIERTRPWSPHAQLAGSPAAWPTFDAVLACVDAALEDVREPAGV